MEEKPLEESGNITPTDGEGTQGQPADAPEQPNGGNPEARTFTQEEVNEIVRERLERKAKAIYSKYGVEDETGFDDVFAKAQAYAEMKERYDSIGAELEAARNEIASYKEKAILSTNGILEDKADDVRTYFKGKGIELSDEALKTVLATHPEWVSAPKVAKPQPIGAPEPNPQKGETERERAEHMFGLKFVS